MSGADRHGLAKLVAERLAAALASRVGNPNCATIELAAELLGPDHPLAVPLAHASAELAAMTVQARRVGGALTDDRLVWGVVANAGRLSRERKARWSHVSDVTGYGSNFSIDLCKRAGFDPDEVVGGDAEDGEA